MIYIELDASVLVSTARKWKSRTIAQKMLANRSIAQVSRPAFSHSKFDELFLSREQRAPRDSRQAGDSSLHGSKQGNFINRI